jgi:Retrotransposon gag protein
MDPVQLEMQREFTVAITELRTEIRRQNDEIQFLRSIPKTKPKASLPDPEKFTGNSYKFDTWLPSIKAKLRIDSDAIGDATAQFYYVYLNLDSQTQAMVLPQLGQAEGTQRWDYNTILDQLTRIYDNPNKVQEAEDRLFFLKQGSDSIITYIAKFERTLFEAQGQDWPDINKISSFRNGLSPTIRSRLTQQLNLPRQYPEFIRIVQQLAGRTQAFQAETSSISKPDRPYSSQIQNHDKMDINQINTIDFTPTEIAEFAAQGKLYSSSD